MAASYTVGRALKRRGTASKLEPYFVIKDLLELTSSHWRDLSRGFEESLRVEDWLAPPLLLRPPLLLPLGPSLADRGLAHDL